MWPSSWSWSCTVNPKPSALQAFARNVLLTVWCPCDVSHCWSPFSYACEKSVRSCRVLQRFETCSIFEVQDYLELFTSVTNVTDASTLWPNHDFAAFLLETVPCQEPPLQSRASKNKTCTQCKMPPPPPLWPEDDFEAFMLLKP